MSKEKVFEEHLIYEEARWGDGYEVSIKTGEEEYQYTKFCVVSPYISLAKGEKASKRRFWKIKGQGDGRGYDFLNDLSDQKFKTKEEAAEFAWKVSKAVTKVTASRPLPEDIKNYIDRKADQIRDTQKELESMVYRLQREKKTLEFLIKEYNVDIIWSLETPDAEKRLTKFLDWEIEPGKTVTNMIYEKYGKDAGRSYRGLLERAIRAMDPTMPEKVDI